MADENFEIRVQDKVDSSVPTKFKGIAAEANRAANAIERLEGALSKLGGANSLERLNNAVNKSALAQEKLLTAQNKTQASHHAVEAALQRRINAEARAAISLEKLSREQNRTILDNNKTTVSSLKVADAQQKLVRSTAQAVTAQNNSATAAQRLVTEQQRTATAVAQTNLVMGRQATEAQRLATEQQRTASASASAAAAQQRLATAQVNTVTAQQRLATAQQQTISATTNAATAQQRLTNATTQGQVATQNLANAQARGAVVAQNLQTAQQRTAVATANAAAAQTRAQTAAIRLQIAQARLNATAQQTSSIFSSMGARITAALGAGLGSVEVLKLADSYTNLQNKLQNVTRSQEEVNILTRELADLAMRTRSALDPTVTSFARFDRALKNLGRSQYETLRMTETINKALIISGATTAEAQSALLQLSQAFNAGRLMGDEFRAVSENMPVVLDALAKQLNVPVMALKKMSSEGKITADIMFKAFESVRDEIDRTFAKTTPTIAQSFTNLRTAATMFFGELDKKLGVTRAIANALGWMAENLDIVATAATGVAAVLAAAFAPKVVAGVVAAGTALAGVGVALAANPIGAAVAAIATAGAGLYLFGDKVKMGEAGLYTLKDAAQATFNIVSGKAREAAQVIDNELGTSLDGVKQNLSELPDAYEGAFETVINAARGFGNVVIGLFVGVGKVIAVTAAHLPYNFKSAYNTIANYTADIVETVVNSWQKGFRLIGVGLQSVMPGVAQSLNNAMDSLTLRLPRLDTSNPVNTVEEFKAIWDEAVNVDHIGEFSSKVAKEATMLANARRALIDSQSGTSLRGQGPNLASADDDDKGGKAAEKRAAALAKVNAQLDNEIERMFTLQPLRDQQARFDAIEEQLLGKRIQLTAQEVKSIKEKIATIYEAKQVQQQYDAIYQRASGPLREYNATVQAAGKLLEEGAIGQDKFVAEVTAAAIAYQRATDPLASLNEELETQIHLLGVAKSEREVESQVLERVNAARAAGMVIDEAQARAKIQQLQEVNRQLRIQAEMQQMIDNMPGGKDYSKELETLKQYQSALSSIWDSSVKPLQAVEAQLYALNQAFQAGVVTVDTYKQQLAMFNIETAKLLNQLGYGDGSTYILQTFEQIMQGFVNLSYNTSELLGNTFNTFADGLGDSLGRAIVYGEDLGDALMNVARSAVAELISGLVKLGIQYALNQTLASTSLAATTTASAAAAAATASAWSPAAAMVSLASYGANAAPASMGITSVTTLAKTLAMAGFREGGYTGNVGVNQVAGVVHGQEFVMDAAATQRIGVANLQALQSGAATVQRGNIAGSGGSNITVEAPQQSTKIINVLDPSIVGQYLNTEEGEQLIMNVVHRNQNAIGG